MKFGDSKTLVFRIGYEEYGVHISQVVSIERMQEITAFPNRPPHVLGVTTVRNVVTPVVDMRTALVGESLEASDMNRIIIVMVKDQEIGLVVDAATHVIDIVPDTIQQPHLMQTNEVSYLLGMAKLDTRLIILLDIEKLVEDTTNLDELKVIKDKL